MKGLLRNIISSPPARFLGCAVFICAVLSDSFSQTSGSQPGSLDGNYFSEELYIATDRDIYISGEQVYFKVYCFDRLTHKPSDLSKVAYASLLDHSANPVSQVKAWLNGSSGSGELSIPDTLKTGNYYISCSTHWMRNFSPDLFACRKISVINPFISIEHIRIPPREYGPDTTTPAVAVNTVNEPAVEGRFESDKKVLPVFSVNADMSVFKPRGKVMIQITTDDPEGNPVSLYSRVGAKLLLVDFWAAWCGPCRQENPNVVKVYKEFNKKGFDVFGVSLDRTKDAWVKAISDDKLTWTHVSDLQYWNSAAAQLYAVSAIPANFLLDENGVIIGRNLREQALYNKVKEVLVGN